MSRMYNAPRETSFERKTGQDTNVVDTVEPIIVSGAEKLPPAKANIILEDIARYPWNPSITSLPTLEERGEGIEQFRSLRSQIYEFSDQAPLKTILVSSGIPAEGKTFVAANLAMSLARNSKHNTLLIDADLRGPSLHTLLGTSHTPGLAEYLAGNVEISDIMQRNQNPRNIAGGMEHNIPDLTFIPAGKSGDNASELVANHRIEELIAALAPHFDWIIIDSPPVLAFADAIDLAHAADAVLLVARGASTTYDIAQRTQAAFSNAHILGFVLNAVKNAPNNSSYYYHYYDKQKDDSRPHRRKGKQQTQ
jgi:protein-tyrosine kinase